jgi:hypothetical protein
MIVASVVIFNILELIIEIVPNYPTQIAGKGQERTRTPSIFKYKMF